MLPQAPVEGRRERVRDMRPSVRPPSHLLGMELRHIDVR